MNRLRDEEEFAGRVTRINRPRAVILLPARELVSQVLVSATGLSRFSLSSPLIVCG